MLLQNSLFRLKLKLKNNLKSTALPVAYRNGGTRCGLGGLSLCQRVNFASSEPYKEIDGGKVVLVRKNRSWIDSNKETKPTLAPTEEKKKEILVPNDLTPRSLSSLIGIRVVDILKVIYLFHLYHKIETSSHFI